MSEIETPEELAKIMGKEIQKRAELVVEKPTLTIGTIGHVSHGKTSLTAAIVKYFGDREKAERLRPDTIRGIEL